MGFMKTTFFSLVVLTLYFINTDCHAGFSKSKPKLESREVLLTYPKSGTNLTICTLQILTGKPARTHAQLGTNNDLIGTNRLKLNLDQTKTPLWRTHEASRIRNLDPNTSKLLFVIRNYKECIMKRQKENISLNFSPTQLRNCIVNSDAEFNHYIDNLNFYNSWPNDETKLIIYYEDLISQPRVEICKILDFFGEQDADVDGFFANYDYWAKRILDSYIKQRGAQHSSGGNKAIYHSKDFPISILQEIDQSVQVRYPVLWEKYLNRYETVGDKPDSKSLF